MAFLSRVLRPRGRRRPGAARSGATKRRSTARSTKDVRPGISLRTVLDRMAHSLTRSSRSVDGKKIVAVYRHGTCTVNHRSKKAASRCRR